MGTGLCAYCILGRMLAPSCPEPPSEQHEPQALASMAPGQLLDEDPVTGARLTVEYGGGTGQVVLLTELNGATLRLGYDPASGVLSTMETTNSTAGITLQLQLAGG